MWRSWLVWDRSGFLVCDVSTLARGQMGGNAYLQYDCVIYVFILGLMILVITPPDSPSPDGCFIAVFE